MTNSGGVNNKGVLFQYDPNNNIYLKKIDFNGSVNGSNPSASLIQASDGKLYGMTPYGETVLKLACFYELYSAFYHYILTFGVILGLHVISK